MIGSHTNIKEWVHDRLSLSLAQTAINATVVRGRMEGWMGRVEVEWVGEEGWDLVVDNNGRTAALIGSFRFIGVRVIRVELAVEKETLFFHFSSSVVRAGTFMLVEVLVVLVEQKITNINGSITLSLFLSLFLCLCLSLHNSDLTLSLFLSLYLCVSLSRALSLLSLSISISLFPS